MLGDGNSHMRGDIHITDTYKVIKTHTCKENKYNSHSGVIKLTYAKREETWFEPKTSQ